MPSRLTAVALLFLACPALAAGWSCDRLKREIAATYGFRPSKLSDAEREAKTKQMDAVWSAVHAEPAKLAPCLRDVLAKTKGDPWLLFDGGQLLLDVDPSPESKRLFLDALNRVPLDDVDLGTWVHFAATFGLEDFDTSALGKRWLTYPDAEYYLPEHAAYHVNREVGALFIFGSMDERFATPALLDLTRTATGDAKTIALALLAHQATPEAKARQASPLIEPRAKPRTTRAEFIAAFNALLRGDAKPFDALIAAVPDGERDLVAVAKDEDIPLLRKVRRHYAATTSPHAIDYYNQFTQILLTLEDRRSRPSSH